MRQLEEKMPRLVAELHDRFSSLLSLWERLGEGEDVTLLTDGYISAAAEMSFPIPSDYGLNGNECCEMIQSEFRAFLLEWRRRIDKPSKEPRL